MNGSVLHFFCLLHFFSHYSFVVSLLVSVVFKVEIIASALHERWRAGRKQPDGTYAPHKKIYERAVCDTAALTYTELPALAQGVLRASARCVCVAIDEALRDPMSGGTSRSSAVAALVGDGDFVESAAALHHGHWKKHADRGSDPAMLVPYAKLADRQKESSRIIVATALEQYFDECLAAEVAAHDRDEAAAALAAEKEKSPDFGALTFETELQSMNCIQVRARSYRYASLLRFAVFRSKLNVRSLSPRLSTPLRCPHYSLHRVHLHAVRAARDRFTDGAAAAPHRAPRRERKPQTSCVPHLVRRSVHRAHLLLAPYRVNRSLRHEHPRNRYVRRRTGHAKRYCALRRHAHHRHRALYAHPLDAAFPRRLQVADGGEGRIRRDVLPNCGALFHRASGGGNDGGD